MISSQEKLFLPKRYIDPLFSCPGTVARNRIVRSYIRADCIKEGTAKGGNNRRIITLKLRSEQPFKHVMKWEKPITPLPKRWDILWPNENAAVM